MERNHVLLITTDHWFGSLLGGEGHPVVQTPTLDALARLGTTYTRAYSDCPVCIPARRTLMTGAPARVHGDRVFDESLAMPPLTTLAAAFGDAGYQTYAVGKLHVNPPRDRIGFDDVWLAEEGRTAFGAEDDYELFLGERGHAGQQFAHGMGNNDFAMRPWHLDEASHVTNWITQQMARVIRRRDPTRPAFWYLSYTHPHPPLAPLAHYLDLYRDAEIDAPATGSWSEDTASLPYAVRINRLRWSHLGPRETRQARMAFYALCTHIDHQLRVIVGTLREEGILDRTVILFTSDHGEMLGNHGLWVKRLLYENSARVPLILVGAAGDERVPVGRRDDRLVGLQDVMPTLLGLAGCEVPASVTGRSLVGSDVRDHLYAEFGEDERATRMITDGRHKLIYYPAGNRSQLFDLAVDPAERDDLVPGGTHAEVVGRLTARLIAELYGGDVAWVRDGELVGMPEPTSRPRPDRGLSSQRGSHWPRPPARR